MNGNPTGVTRTVCVRALTICSLVLGVTVNAATDPAPIVGFDWFEYVGRDAVFEQPLPEGHFRNPILAGFFPDPNICRVGDDYYLINSTFAYFPGIPVFHSRDLVSWTLLGHVIDRPDQLNYDGLGVSRGLFAPAISHHDGTFYVVCTMVDAGGNFLVTASDPAGPWSDPVWLGIDGIDPSLFFDADGRAWLVNNGGPPNDEPLYEGHRAIWQQEFDVDRQELTGPRSIIVNGGVDLASEPVWIEGPHLYQRNGWYYLTCAEGGTGDNHSQVIFRSRSVTGPFVPWEKNPILTQRDLDSTIPLAVTTVGHADLFIGPDEQWWSVFLGCRPYGGHYYNTGRETFLLPVTWIDDWPLILQPGERVPYVVTAPERASGTDNRAPASTSPMTGNFTWRDDFTGASLSPHWIMLRRPHEVWFELNQEAGQLGLQPRADTLGGRGNPSFIARRLQHARFDVSTSINVPLDSGVAAGLVAFQNETHHYFFGVRRVDDTLYLFLEQANGGDPEQLAEVTIEMTDRLELRLTGDDLVCAFSYRMPDRAWAVLVRDADATILSTQTAGGFVGATVGLHARLESAP